MTVEFTAVWAASALGEHRPCEDTYGRFPYDSVPSLDDLPFTGSYEWFGDLGEVVDDQRTAALRDLERAAAAAGVVLPADFVTFETHSKTRGALVEASCCWSNLSGLMPSPFEEGAYLVRFLRDQQDCVIWYLYLRPGQDAFVVHSHELAWYLDHPLEDDDWEPQPELTAAELAAEVSWCAPSFEQFAYRFRVENRLWDVLVEGSREPEPAERDYLERYALCRKG
ncbi:hypothetical protein [Umezawaea sp. Da 62-37]|uniref:hypothetical protein n=1 Tax=Umezawaea sp. Da 62-37 TaxID=3075927 RepID=UPI0028F73526|nr:hypothetical protein [Umezawaea sp. Da 62-37]WNV91642.1 hypothetical protein RM788_26315 [Umezawaea sp. Da 62-37]